MAEKNLKREKNSEKEIEEAHKKVRGEKEPKSEEKKSEKKEEKLEKKKETVEETLLEEAEETELLAKKPREIIDLEAITKKEPALPAEVRDDYAEQLKNRPVMDIYNEVKDIYRAVEEKGYMNPTEQRKVEYARVEVESRLESETYSFTEETAMAASVTQQLSASMMGMYKAKKMKEMYKS